MWLSFGQRLLNMDLVRAVQIFDTTAVIHSAVPGVEPETVPLFETPDGSSKSPEPLRSILERLP